MDKFLLNKKFARFVVDAIEGLGLNQEKLEAIDDVIWDHHEENRNPTKEQIAEALVLEAEDEHGNLDDIIKNLRLENSIYSDNAARGYASLYAKEIYTACKNYLDGNLYGYIHPDEELKIGHEYDKSELILLNENNLITLQKEKDEVHLYIKKGDGEYKHTAIKMSELYLDRAKNHIGYSNDFFNEGSVLKDFFNQLEEYTQLLSRKKGG